MYFWGFLRVNREQIITCNMTWPFVWVFFLALKVATFWMVRVGKNTLKCIGFEKYVNRYFAQKSYLKWAKIHDCEATAYNQQYSEYWTLRRSDIDNVRVDGQRQEKTWLWLRTVKTNQLGHSNYYYYFFFWSLGGGGCWILMSFR